MDVPIRTVPASTVDSSGTGRNTGMVPTGANQLRIGNPATSGGAEHASAVSRSVSGFAQSRQPVPDFTGQATSSLNACIKVPGLGKPTVNRGRIYATYEAIKNVNISDKSFAIFCTSKMIYINSVMRRQRRWHLVGLERMEICSKQVPKLELNFRKHPPRNRGQGKNWEDKVERELLASRMSCELPGDALDSSPQQSYAREITLDEIEWMKRHIGEHGLDTAVGVNDTQTEYWISRGEGLNKG
ncbi:hypothetical protein R3P38DRAFT_2792972 [Favolaschia claudopus]|uniref:Uncharacterized protein n=1 Tax=Favolaschia claudopus TaxID=2862362 RepID=A0AAW0AE83_9AGAR